jgi:serine/threonine-protein kinase
VAPHTDQLIAGKYRLIQPLARGGMGALWVARHVELDTDVAIKFRADAERYDTAALDRFKREAQAAARLRSPNVVHIHDYGVDEGVPYIAMELLQGEDLGDLLDREQRLSLGRTLEFVRQAAKGLDCAHRADIVHRDVKPSNLYLARFGNEEVLKVLDFGIAKRVSSERPEEASSSATSQSVVLGSPSYMSPEQARGHTVGQASDLWSLGAVVYRALVGVPPFVGLSAQDTVIKICTERVTPPSACAPDLPSELDGFFERALARDASQRFASAGELSAALAAISERHADHRPQLPMRETPRGRMTATASLAPAAEIEPAASTTGRRRTLWVGAGLAIAVIGIVLLGRQVAREHADDTASPPAARAVASSAPPPTPAARAPEPTLPPEAAPSESAPKVAPTPKRSANATAPRDSSGHKAPQATAPKLDPVFGLPLPPTASGTP